MIVSLETHLKHPNFLRPLVMAYKAFIYLTSCFSEIHYSHLAVRTVKKSTNQKAGLGIG